MGSVCCVPAKSRENHAGSQHETNWQFNQDYSPHVSSTWGDSMSLRRASFSSNGDNRGGSQVQFMDHRRTFSTGGFSQGISPSSSFRSVHWNPLAPARSSQAADSVFSSSDFHPSPSLMSSKESLSRRGFSIPCTPESLANKEGQSGHLQAPFFSKSMIPTHHLTRNVSDNRLLGNHGHPLEERGSFRWSGSSAGESSLGSSDWWSVQTFSDLVVSSQRERERLRWTSASSPSDFIFSHEDRESSELAMLEYIKAYGSCTPRSDLHTCALCSRLLSQRSPTILCPVVSVLPCGHVFHADCLERSTQDRTSKEPPCPQCTAGADDGETMSSKDKVKSSLPALVGVSSRNKLSRIGIMTDDAPSSGSLVKDNAGTKLQSGERAKSLSRRAFSFRGRGGKDVLTETKHRKPGSPARVSPENEFMDFPLPVNPKKGHAPSFSYFRRKHKRAESLAAQTL